MDGLITLLHLFLYFIIMISVIRSDEEWRGLFKVSIFVSSLVALIGLIQFFGGFDIEQGGVRLTSTMGNALFLSSYLLIHTFLIFFLLAKAHISYLARNLYIITAILHIVVIYYTASRSTLLGLIVGIGVMAIWSLLSNRFNNKKYKKIILAAIVLSMLLAPSFYLGKETSFVKNSPTLLRISEVSIESIHNQPRVILWNLTLQGFAENPIFGLGNGNFEQVYDKYYDPRLSLSEFRFDNAHNVFLKHLIGAGIFGLISYLSIFVIAIMYILKALHASKLSYGKALALVGLFAAYFTQRLFSIDTLSDYILIFILLGFLHYISTSDSVETSGKSKRNSLKDSLGS